MQSWAFLVDAYRELNHRRLFWVSLLLSFLAVAVFAIVGINERGITILSWTLQSAQFNSTLVGPATFYKLIFVGLGIKFWLSWIATILALITTAGMIPDLVASGSIDLIVSKPISRTRIFLSKFAGGLLFAALQVTIFTVACFVVLGVRGGVWEPSLFLAIPLVILFYSYLFSFCALVALVTRSTVASLLTTLLFWGLCALLWAGSIGVTGGRIANELEVKSIERALASRIEEEDRTRLETDLAWHRNAQVWWDRAARGFEVTVTILPKTTATVDILERTLVSRADLPSTPDGPDPPVFRSRRVRLREFSAELEKYMETVTPVWVIGTSLGFVAVMLGLSVWIFSRRDY